MQLVKIKSISWREEHTWTAVERAMPPMLEASSYEIDWGLCQTFSIRPRTISINLMKNYKKHKLTSSGRVLTCSVLNTSQSDWLSRLQERRTLECPVVFIHESASNEPGNRIANLESLSLSRLTNLNNIASKIATYRVAGFQGKVNMLSYVPSVILWAGNQTRDKELVSLSNQ